MLHVNRSRWYVLVPLVLVSSAGLIAASRPAPLRPCEVIANWVAAHKAELPTTLAEFAKFSKAYRREMYSSMTAEARVSVWREHLTSFLAPTAGLTEAQRDLVQHVMNELDVLVTDPTGERGRDQLAREHLVDAAQALFSREQITDIFTLNTVGSETGVSAAPSAELAESADGALLSSTGSSCSCSVEGGGFWDCDVSGCVDDGNCLPTLSGCGFIGDERCDGVCKQTQTQ
jgi:hypothetical protein